MELNYCNINSIARYIVHHKKYYVAAFTKQHVCTRILPTYLYYCDYTIAIYCTANASIIKLNRNKGSYEKKNTSVNMSHSKVRLFITPTFIHNTRADIFII